MNKLNEMNEYEELYDYVERWRRHYKMLEKISESNLDKKYIELWRSSIDNYFSNKIKSSL